jgi:hypothetical protein
MEEVGLKFEASLCFCGAVGTTFSTAPAAPLLLAREQHGERAGKFRR